MFTELISAIIAYLEAKSAYYKACTPSDGSVKVDPMTVEIDSRADPEQVQQQVEQAVSGLAKTLGAGGPGPVKSK
jgi:hypothetical protein